MRVLRRLIRSHDIYGSVIVMLAFAGSTIYWSEAGRPMSAVLR